MRLPLQQLRFQLRPRPVVNRQPVGGKARARNRSRRNRVLMLALAAIVVAATAILWEVKVSAAVNFLTTWGTFGSGIGQLNQPFGVAVDSASNVYVADSANHRIEKFDSAGAYITQWGGFGAGDGQFVDPYGVAVDSSGNVYVTEKGNDRVQKFTSTGSFITKWGTNGTGDGEFNSPRGIAVDSPGNVYVADNFNHRIQKFTSTGSFITKWGTNGTGDGQFNQPDGVAVDSAGNVYVADSANNRVEKFTSTGSFITKWGSLGSGNGQFDTPIGVAVDSSANVYVTDQFNNRVQKFSSTGTFIMPWGTVGSGDGQFNLPQGVAVDSSGNVYVADQFNHRIQKFGCDAPEVYFTKEWGTATSGNVQLITPVGVAVDSSGNVYVLDGSRVKKFTSTGGLITQWGSSGPGDGQFNSPQGVAVDSAGNVYVADTVNDRIQKFDSAGNFITKWGTSGTGDRQFSRPQGVTVDSSGNVYVSDTVNNRIQKFTSTGSFITKWGKNGGDGTDGSGDGEFFRPFKIAVDSAGNVYVTETENDRLQKFTSAGVFITKWGANGGDGTPGTGDGEFFNPAGVAVDSAGNVYVADGNQRIQKFSSTGTFIKKWGTDGSGNGQFRFPREVAVDAAGNVYVADQDNNRIQKFTSAGTFITKWGTNGTGDGDFKNPQAIALDSSGNVYVADTINHRIQKFTSAGTFITKWGTNGSGNGQFANPQGVTVDASGNVYVSDTANHRIQKFTSTGTFLTTWGSFGSGNGLFKFPEGMAVDSAGNVYVADLRNNLIQKFTSTGAFITQWGGFGNGNGQFNDPYGVAVDASGNVYVADSLNRRVQKFTSTGTFITKWGEFGSGEGEFGSPRGVGVDSAGNVYVSDGFHRVQKFTSAGAFITQWGTNGTGDGQFNSPQGVAVDLSGNVYVTDIGNDRIEKFSQGSPVANAGADLSFDCVKPTQAIPLNGTASTDPTPGDSATLFYAWSEGTTVLGTGKTPQVNLAPGTHTITLAVTDSCLHTSFDTVTVQIVAYNSVDCNSAPEAVDDTLSVAEDSGSNAIDVLANDTDYDTTDTKTIVAKTNGAHGTVTITGGGTGLTYTPAANYSGPDSFTYRINDGEVNSPTDATVHVTVTPRADTPSVTNATTAENTRTTSGLVISRNSADNTTTTHFKITSITSGTLYQANGTTVINNNQFITFAQGNAGLKFLPSAGLTSPGSTFSFKVQASTSAVDAGLGGSLATATITVTEGGTLKFSAATYSVNEATASVTITATRTGGSGGATSIKYATSNGTATGYTSCAAGKDYVTKTGTLSWAAGDAANKSFTIPICNDLVFEGNETVNLALSDVTGSGSLGTPPTAVLTIVDNETQPTVSINNISMTEGNAAVNTTFTVKLSGASSKTVTVKYATQNGTAIAPADYTAKALTTLTFQPGEISKTVTVTVAGDLLDEVNETFKVTLSSPVNTTIATGLGTGTCTITDNDLTPNLRVNNPPIAESNVTATVNFAVILSAPSGQVVTVKYATANGTAVAPADYAAKALTTLTFQPGETTKFVPVTVTGDTLDEATETFKLNLSSPVNAIISAGTGTCTITDNDPPPSVRVNNPPITEGNAAITVNFAVILSAPSGQTVKVNFATANGTALTPSDYTAKSLTTLTFLPGETIKMVPVIVAGDTLDEPTETFRLLLSSPVNTTISAGTGTCTITDNDPTPGITISNASVTEPDSAVVNAVFSIKLSAASGQTVSVKYVTANGTSSPATAGTDYTAVALTTLTFLPGQTVKTVSIQVKGEMVKEANETFLVNLSGGVNATITDAQAVGTILNDD